MKQSTIDWLIKYDDKLIMGFCIFIWSLPLTALILGIIYS